MLSSVSSCDSDDVVGAGVDCDATGAIVYAEPECDSVDSGRESVDRKSVV